MKKTIINAKNAPAAVGPYVHAVKAGNFVFTSGQIGLIPETGVLARGIAAQTEQVLKNLGAVLSEAGLAYTDVIKTTVDVYKRQAGYRVWMTDLAVPTAVRRSVSFSRAVYEGKAEVEGIRARLADSLNDGQDVYKRQE